MSCQRGNTQRSRPQKYQNSHKFKNNLHDTSHITKSINTLQVSNVCKRCKDIIEWKIKYKKYKPLKVPAKCIKCEQKAVKYAYHTICGPCAKSLNVCAKCTSHGDIIEAKPTDEEQVKLDAEMQTMLKSLPERKRRTFIRFMNKDKVKKDKKKKSKNKVKQDIASNKESEAESEQSEDIKLTREDLVNKLKFLMVDAKLDDDNFSDDFSLNSDNNDSDLSSVEDDNENL